MKESRGSLIAIVVVFIISLFAVVFLATDVISEPVEGTNTHESVCPDTSYNINTEEDPICKSEPTGCPYGDSIPMDICYAKFGEDRR